VGYAYQLNCLGLGYTKRFAKKYVDNALTLETTYGIKGRMRRKITMQEKLQQFRNIFSYYWYLNP
jgi:hypothetical protein